MVQLPLDIGLRQQISIVWIAIGILADARKLALRAHRIAHRHVVVCHADPHRRIGRAYGTCALEVGLRKVEVVHTPEHIGRLNHFLARRGLRLARFGFHHGQGDLPSRILLMPLVDHYLGNRQAHANAVATRRGKRPAETIHSTSLIAQHAQCRASRQIDRRRSRSGLVTLRWHELGILLRQLHIPQGLFSIPELRIGTGQQRIGVGIVRRELLRDPELVDGLVIAARGI